MTALYPGWLRPDMHPEQVRLSTGKVVTVYRCPFPAEGPIQVSGADGRAVLRFMYGHFVFTWPERSPTLDIGHGTLARSAPLWPAQPISGEWTARTLTRFGQRWTHSHLGRYTAHPNGGPT